MGLNWSLAGPQFNALEALQSYGRGEQMAHQQQDWERKQRDYQRQDEARSALGSLVSLGMQSRPAVAGGSILRGGAPAEELTAPPRAAALQRLAQADPETAIRYQAQERAATKDQLDIFHKLNGQALQLLGGVTDQASYDAAKRRALALYARYGVSLDDHDLPDEYSPKVVRGLMMSAIDTDKQLTQLRADRRLDNDIADDDADNARADRNTNSVIEDRGARRSLTARGQDMADARGRYSTGVASADRRRGQDLSHQDRVSAQDRRTPARGGRGGAPRNPDSMIPGASAELPVTVTTVAQAKMLPKGTFFKTPDGRTMRVP